jgi:hypothetical protein
MPAVIGYDKGEDNWRAESDHRTIQSAAEIMADQIRMRGVIRHQAKMKKAQTKMASMLAGHKRAGSLKY